MPLERSSYSSYLLHTHKISLSKKTLYTYIENNIFKNIGIDISTLPSLDKRTLLFFSWHQYDTFHMARYVLIDVSFREPIQTNVDCSKISPFVCGNISTNSVAKKYWYISLSISPVSYTHLDVYKRQLQSHAHASFLNIFVKGLKNHRRPLLPFTPNIIWWLALFYEEIGIIK